MRVRIAATSDPELSRWFVLSHCVRHLEPWRIRHPARVRDGLSVVAWDDPGLHSPEHAYLRRGENCLLFGAGSAEDLARQLVSVLQSPGLRDHLADGARATVAGATLSRMVDGSVEPARLALDERRATPATEADRHR
jgi:hypothetical protein